MNQPTVLPACQSVELPYQHSNSKIQGAPICDRIRSKSNVILPNYQSALWSTTDTDAIWFDYHNSNPALSTYRPTMNYYTLPARSPIDPSYQPAQLPIFWCAGLFDILAVLKKIPTAPKLNAIQQFRTDFSTQLIQIHQRGPGDNISNMSPSRLSRISSAKGLMLHTLDG